MGGGGEFSHILKANTNSYSLPPESELLLKRKAFAHRLLSALGIFQENKNHPIEKPLTQELMKRLNSFAKEEPEILPSSWLSIPWDRVKRLETGVQLLKHMYEQRGYDTSLAPPQDSVLILCQAVGCDITPDIADQISENRLRNLYAILLDIRENMTFPPLAALKISKELYTKSQLPQLEQFLIAARNLMSLYGNNDVAWKKIISQEKLEQKNITPDNIASITQSLVNHTQQFLLTVFKKEGVEISPQQLTSLLEGVQIHSIK